MGTCSNNTICCDHDAIMHRPWWHIVSWLVSPESVNRNPRILFDPHQFAFTLLTTTTHPLLWLATLPSVHPLYAGNPSTGNRSPVSMLMSLLGLPPTQLILILRPIWCDLSHGIVVDTSDSISLDFPTMLACSYPSWRGELRSSPTSSTLEKWPLSSV